MAEKQNQTINGEVQIKPVMADPTALGVFGLAIVTFVASTSKLGWLPGHTYVIPWSIFLGSLAQLTASMVDFKKANYYGAIVLGAFGFFWMAVAAHWAIGLGWFGDVGTADPRHFAVACLGYFIFCLFITVVTFEVNKVFAIILVLVDILLISLVLQIFGINPAFFGSLGAYSELMIGILGFYAAGAIFMNNFFGRQILPLGKPMGWIKR